MEFHEVANIFPMMTPAEMMELRQDMRENGYRSSMPILLYDGQIIDGRNRYTAALAEGIEPVYADYPGGDPLKFVISTNLHRRHLNETQRAVIASRLANMPQHLHKTDMQICISQPEAAEMLNVSTRSVASVKAIEREAPELIEKMASGEMTTHEANKKVKKRKTEMRINQFIADAPPALAFSGFAPNTISVCDIYDLKLPNACADMIFTDPPYDDESLPLFARLAEFGAEVLKPGAYLMTYCGKMFLPQVIASLGKHLEYVWTFCVYQPDSNHKIQKHHLFQAWRPIICYKKPGVSVYADWQPDVVKGTRNKDFHEWQQQIEPPLKYISAYTPIGGLVIDPFIGSGTTALACKQTGRNYLGFDKGIDAVRISLSRLQ